MERRRLIKGMHSYVQRGKRINLDASDPNNDIGEFDNFDFQVPDIFKDRFSEPLGVAKSEAKPSRRTTPPVEEKKEEKADKVAPARYFYLHRGGGRFNVYDRTSDTPDTPVNTAGYLSKIEAQEMVDALESK